MNLTYCNNIPSAKQFKDLFNTTGWYKEKKITIKMLQNLLENSYFTVSVYDKDKLIGFGRIISDGVMHALILDLIVDPNYQGQGIGSKILSKLVSKCKDDKIFDIQLFSALNKKEFYLKNGFRERPEDAPGMEIKT